MEQVNHPKHYQKNGKECIQEMEERYGIVTNVCFCVLNDFKYRWRAGSKDGNSESQDLQKGNWYMRYSVNAYKRMNLWQKFVLFTFHHKVYRDIKDFIKYFVY